MPKYDICYVSENMQSIRYLERPNLTAAIDAAIEEEMNRWDGELYRITVEELNAGNSKT